MKGNFSRLTRANLPPEFSAVLLQQGRVLLDSDWNDLVEILERELRIRTRMIVGKEGGPKDRDGFGLHFRCGVDLNSGGERDKQYDQGVVLRRKNSLPFRENSADLAYTIRVDFLVPATGSCGELPRAVLLSVPGRWTIYVERDLCLVLVGHDDKTPHPLGTIEADRLQTLCVAYDGGEVLHVWSFTPPLKKKPRSDEIENPAWENANTSAHRFVLTFGASHRGDENLRCTLAGLWIWDAAMESGSDPDPAAATSSSCQIVCDLDLSRIETRPEIGDAFIYDSSGKGNHGWIRLRQPDQNLPPVRLLGLTIGAGEYVVDGVEVENSKPVGFAKQPWQTGELASPTIGATVTYLFYLDVWERFVSALQYPQIVEPALGGPDTTARTQTIWQVRAIVAPSAREVENRWDSLQARNEKRGRAKFFRPPNEVGQAGNKLYRVEIHSPGWALQAAREPQNSSAIIVDRASSNLVTVIDPDIASMLAVDSPVALWSDGELAEPFLTMVTCVEGNQRFELAKLPGQWFGAFRLQPIASFKWSRENGAIAFPVRTVMRGDSPDPQIVFSSGITPPSTSASSGAPTKDSGTASDHWTFLLDNAGYNGFDIQVGYWLELLDDALDLARAGGTFFPVVTFDVNQLTITVSSLRPLKKIELGVQPILRRWEVSANHASATGGANIGEFPPPLGVVLGSPLLEQSIHVEFAGNGFYAGADYWVVPVRDEVGDGLLWPGDKPLPPEGIALHRAKLATLQLGLGLAKTEDLRAQFASLTELTKQKDEAAAPGSKTTLTPEDVVALLGTLLNQTWAGRARILASGDDDLPGLEKTGMTVDARSLAAATWKTLDTTDGPSGAGVGTLWQKRPVFLGASPVRLDEGGVWRSLPVPDKRADFAACASGSRLWLFGGRDLTARDTRALSSIKYLDGSAASEWKTLRLTMNPPAIGHSAALLNGRIHLVGGVAEDGSPAPHQVFDPKNQSFTYATGLLTPRKNLALVEHEGDLYAIGGTDSNDGFLGTIERWDASSDSWSIVTPRSEGATFPPLADISAVSLPEGIVVAGGFDGAAKSDVWLFRPAQLRWESLAPLSNARSRGGLVSTSDYAEPGKPALYAIGGVGDRNAKAPVETLPIATTFQLFRASQT